MPAPHDLDPPSMTDEERRAKRVQEAAIGYELHFDCACGCHAWDHAPHRRRCKACGHSPHDTEEVT